MPSDTPNPVLILDGPDRIVLAIARSLHRHGIPVDAAHFTSTSSPGLCSRAIRSVLEIADAAGSRGRLFAELSNLAAVRGYDMVIPASDAALAALRSCYGPLSRRMHVATPPPGIVTRVLEKSFTLRAAAECGIPIPRSWDAAERMPELTDLPLVCKPADKAADALFRVRHVRTTAELEALLRLVEGCEDRYLWQEYCPGEGVGSRRSSGRASRWRFSSTAALRKTRPPAGSAWWPKPSRSIRRWPKWRCGCCGGWSGPVRRWWSSGATALPGGWP